MRIASLSAAFLLGWTLLAYATQTGTPDTLYYPLSVTVATTSDWVSVTLSSGGECVGLDWEVTQGNWPRMEISVAGSLHMMRPCCQELRVTIVFSVLVNPTESTMVWTIDQGALGETSVTVCPGGTTADTHVLARAQTEGNPGTIRLPVRNILDHVTNPLSVGAVRRSSPPAGQLALAFYYPWYGTPSGPAGEWVHWDPTLSRSGEFVGFLSTDEPLSGYYDSLDAETIRRHIQEARQASIDGLICSWWGVKSFEERAFARVIQVAEQEGFSATVYYEKADSVMRIVHDVEYIVRTYGGSPAFLKVGGLPVIFFYARAIQQFPSRTWALIFELLRQDGVDIYALADGLDSQWLDLFDGIHTYAAVAMPLPDVARQYEALSVAATSRDRLFAATVSPGFEATPPRQLYVDRAGGSYYEQIWQAAIASNPTWMLVTSFNEWHEGTEVEPSVEYGADYLIMTRNFVEQWKLSRD